MFKKVIIPFLIITLACLQASAQNNDGYRLPPQEIIELVDAPSTPTVRFSPGNDLILLIENPDMPALSDLATEELRLAGVRFNPATNGPNSLRYGTGLQFMNMDGSDLRTVGGMPDNPHITNLKWASDGKHLAFTHTSGKGIELWVVDVQAAQARQLTGNVVNDVLGTSYIWLPDNQTLLYSAVPAGRGEVPPPPAVASAPVIQESLGRRAAVRTFQDMLSNAYDEALFTYYATSQLVKIDLDGNSTPLLDPGIITRFHTSPDGNYLYLGQIQKPFSYIVPASRFSQRSELFTIEGEFIRLLAEYPVLDDLPQGRGATRTGPRNFRWRADAPATLYYAEALDGGDPRAEAEYRDQLYVMQAPFTADPTPLYKLEWRYNSLTWGRGDFALLTESWPQDRMVRVHIIEPDHPEKAPRLLVERSIEDRYSDPGDLITTLNEYGRSVLQFDRRGRRLFLFGTGASPEGNRPFLDALDVRSGQTERLWRSEAPYFENPLHLVDPDQGLFITRRESNEEHPNIFLRDLRRNRLTQISDFPDPFPSLRELQREMVHYERADGIPLSGTLYLPPGYRPGVDDSLPTILYAYPREFLTVDAAGQVTGSPFTYTRVGATSVVMLATQGYAVLSGAAFPVVSQDGAEPNDTFVEQLVDNGQAAIDYLVERGVTDPDRVGVSGHSYGAFMTANLLTHSDLFAAGVARSGAYNRSLTPFGFQAEERTYWQAPEIYHAMSPFMHADKMKVPMLLIHGIDDNNSGTFPMQSERYYDALRGHGAIVRLVMLPHEGHGYRARESALHMHWEWLEWFDRYVKNRVVE